MTEEQSAEKVHQPNSGSGGAQVDNIFDMIALWMSFIFVYPSYNQISVCDCELDSVN